MRAASSGSSRKVRQPVILKAESSYRTQVLPAANDNCILC